jgi:ABC-type bacteriocin/lantibiotic exporter with double-glycine peptidase domain
MKFREKLNALRNIPLGDWRILMRVLGIYRRKFFLATALSFVGIALSVVVPILSQKIIDSVMVGKDGRAAVVFAVIAICAAVARHLGTRWHNGIINDIEARLTARLSRKIYFRLMRIPYDSSASAGGNTINLLNESQRIASFMLSAAPNFVISILGALVSFVVALYYDYLICLLAVAVTLVFSVFARNTNAQLGETSRASFRLGGVLQGATSETVNNLRGIKSNAVERFFIGRWTAKSATAIKARWHILDLSHSYSFTLSLLTEILTLLVVLVGCLRILQGDLTLAACWRCRC